MAVPRCFTARDRIFYEVGGSGAYNPGLLTPPRIYGEELDCFLTSSVPVGFLYVTREPNRWSDATINVISLMAQVAYPGYGTARWKFDAQYGNFLPPDPDEPLLHEHDVCSVGLASDALAIDPRGDFWWYGIHVSGNAGGATRLNPATMEVDGTPLEIVPADWLDARGDVPTAINHLALDGRNNRMLVQWDTDNEGDVSLYVLSTKTYLSTAHVPNEVSAIALTGDQLFYVVDTSDWIAVYDYSGVFHGICRNPRREVYTGARGGVAYCWDRQYKRMLAIEGRANGTDGHCRVRVRGFYPTPDAQIVCPPFPLKVPRAGRSIVVLSRVYGEGAEPISSVRAQVSGDVENTISSDADGDFLVPVTPETAGSFEVTITADVNATPADTTEP